MATLHKQLNHFAIQVHPFVSTNMGAHLPAYSRHRQIVGLLKKSYDIPGISWFFTMDFLLQKKNVGDCRVRMWVISATTYMLRHREKCTKPLD